MTTEQAKQWIEWYFKDFDEQDSLDSDTLHDRIIPLLCGCFDVPSAALREEYGAETYHDLWLAIVSNEILEGHRFPGYARELDAIYAVYVKDQFERRAPAPSKEGFRLWLGVWLVQDDLDGVMRDWPPRTRG